MFRKEKTTVNQDDIEVWKWGLPLGIVMFFAIPYIVPDEEDSVQAESPIILNQTMSAPTVLLVQLKED